jgi:hypothetical protein
LWYGGENAIANAIGYAEFYSRSHDAVIRVYDAAGNVIETHEHKGDFKGDFVTRLGKRHARA